MGEATAVKKLKFRAKQLKSNIFSIYFAYQDPRVPWYARVLIFLVVAYALSPIDLIPDFIPVLGYLDDLILLPLGIILVLKMIPKEVLKECNKKAEEMIKRKKPKSFVGAAIIIAIWLLIVVLICVLLFR